MTLLPTRPSRAESRAAVDSELLFEEAHRRRRRRRRRILMAIVVAAAAGVATAAVALTSTGSGHARPAASTPAASHPPVKPLGPPPRVAWVDYQGRVHIGSLRTHQQRVVATGTASPTTSMVASGTTLFWASYGGLVYDKATHRLRSLAKGVMAYDTVTGRVRTFASGVQVFNAVDSTDVFIGSDARHLARYSLDGQLLKRFTLPAGWALPDPFGLGTSSPALAHGGILLQGLPPGQAGANAAASSTLAVWTPATGRVQVIGGSSFMIAAHTDSRGAASLIAWLPASCSTSNESCSLQLTDLATGVTRQIGKPLGFGFGFDMRGAFSPDGRQLAVFAKTNSGNYNPETRLALVDVAAGTLRPVAGATISIGEPVAWAQWLPASSQLIVGGTSGEDGSGEWEANHFLVDSATHRSTPFSFLSDGEQDVNYSVVVLP